MSRSHIANTIRLLALPLEVQQLLADDRLSAGHARALLALGEAEAITSLSLRVVAEDLSVRETEDIVRRYIEGPAQKEPRAKETSAGPAEDPNLAEVEEILSEQLATRVSIRMTRKRGQVVIDFGSADDLERIVSEIVGSGPGLAPE